MRVYQAWVWNEAKPDIILFLQCFMAGYFFLSDVRWGYRVDIENIKVKHDKSIENIKKKFTQSSTIGL